MKQLREGQTVRILVDIDGMWATKGQLGILTDVYDGGVSVKCPNGGVYLPVVEVVGHACSLWVDIDHVQAITGPRMPVSPVFLQEVSDE